MYQIKINYDKLMTTKINRKWNQKKIRIKQEWKKNGRSKNKDYEPVH